MRYAGPSGQIFITQSIKETLSGFIILMGNMLENVERNF